jgi:Aspartyl protease
LVSKDFEQTVSFVPTLTAGGMYWEPLVEVTFTAASVSLPFVFDTGASVTTLRHDLPELVGATSWDQGAYEQSSTAGDEALADSYRFHDIEIEIFGMALRCPVDLMKLPPGIFGLLGREGVFDRFGFGFWEGTQEIHITSSP